VIEADEYDRVFLALAPAVAVITNVEWDHPDIYPTAEVYEAAFTQFAAQVADQRRLIVCGDDAGASVIAPPDAQLYGIEEALATDPVSCRLAPLDWTASGVTPNEAGGVSFDVWRYSRRRMAQQRAGGQELLVPGEHNVRNALAALAVCEALGADVAAASAALARFRGTARRFELKGEAGGVTVIDDYAHHPTEARATLAAARARYPGRRIVAYLQPHTFSRTAALMDEWAGACGGADLVLVGDVYAAREEGDAAAMAAALAARIAAAGVDARPAGPVGAAAELLIALARPGDVVLTLGAGDGDRAGTMLLDGLRT
jgi:UDP-N-acetylmuramate--alanine ligase